MNCNDNLDVCKMCADWQLAIYFLTKCKYVHWYDIKDIVNRWKNENIWKLGVSF